VLVPRRSEAKRADLSTSSVIFIAAALHACWGLQLQCSASYSMLLPCGRNSTTNTSSLLTSQECSTVQYGTGPAQSNKPVSLHRPLQSMQSTAVVAVTGLHHPHRRQLKTENTKAVGSVVRYQLVGNRKG
jgi:hypothetical protein